MDEFRGTAPVTEQPWQSVGRVWPWIVVTVAVLIIAVAAVLFSPDTGPASAAPTPTWSGWDQK